MPKTIELDFPFEELDPIAELESWRKEINRPIYHIHKWWANRLGSVFRAILLGTTHDAGTNIWKQFYHQHNLHNMVILDPFMGSGTTLGECVKLGIKPIGCDINPISSFIVRQSLTRVDNHALETSFEALRQDVQADMSQYYQTLNPATGKLCDVLYYFWVKLVRNPKGEGETIPLFKNYIFSKNASPQKKPLAQILCSQCGDINTGRYDTTKLTCTHCGHTFNPQLGTVHGQMVKDKYGFQHKIKTLIAAQKTPPEHRLYAILALTETGKKVYLKPQQFDFDLYEQARQRRLVEFLPLPDMPIRKGHNTNQARGYNYTHWQHFFNERQLLCLGLLLKGILKIDEPVIRDQFLCLFSSTLEFNNLFCSFKGEGTGAVRHLFSHHIFKPEKMPLENNVWGTPKSSGSFSTLFKTRLIPAKIYLDKPFEICRTSNTRQGRQSAKLICSKPLDITVTDDWQTFERHPKAALVLNGDSAHLPLPDASVDAVVTDPPYFDFVHYSELSDFFFAWLSPQLKERYAFFNKPDCRDKREVQNRCPQRFASNLGGVFQECYRIIKENGLLIFSFHHSKFEAWLAIYQAIVSKTGFTIVAAHPVKAEMAVGSPKSRTKEPINIDAIIVCKKAYNISLAAKEVKERAEQGFAAYCQRFEKAQRTLSLSDRHVIMAAQVLVCSSMASLKIDAVKELLEGVFFEKGTVMIQQPELVDNDEKIGQLPLL